MNQSFVLQSPDVLGYLVSMLTQLPLDGTMTVDVHKTREKRRLAQNALYWMWMEDISKQAGHTEDEIHDGCRKTYLSSIYLKEPVGRLQRAWAESYADIYILVSDLSPEDATPIIDRISLLVSTTWANVEQFTEYLGRIEHYCMGKDIILRHPDDYNLATGK